MNPPEHIRRLIIYSEYPELAGRNYLQNTGRLALMQGWEEVIAALRESYGDAAKVAVYPNADIQYSK